MHRKPVATRNFKLRKYALNMYRTYMHTGEFILLQDRQGWLAYTPLT